ncbi:MAG: amidohydrolase family protein, partial [Acidimicrobiia bacterium]
MIVDGHVHIGDRDPVWGKARFDGDDLISLMDEPIRVLGEEVRVDRAVAMPRIGATTVAGVSFADQHKVVVDAVAKYPERLSGNFVLNPRLGLDEGLAELRRLVGTGTFRMVKLHPTLHNYWPQEAALTYPIFE